jgi:hypothetical protein
MKNPANHIRAQIFSLLNGNVVYQTQTITVQEREVPPVPDCVLIGKYYHRRRPNKHSFIYDGVIELEVISVQHEGTSKRSDEITELVCNLLHPTPGSDLLTTADFQFIPDGGPDFDPIWEDSISGQKVTRRLIKYNLLVAEK